MIILHLWRSIMASLPSNKNWGLWAAKVTSCWRWGPSTLHGSLGSIWIPSWSAPSFSSSHHRNNARWHESGGGLSKNAWLHLNANATHEIGASLRMQICPNCTHNRTQSVHDEGETRKSVVIQGGTCITGQPAVQQRFHIVPPLPPRTHTHTHRWGTDAECGLKTICFSKCGTSGPECQPSLSLNLNWV